jgi:hypothetical protein
MIYLSDEHQESFRESDRMAGCSSPAETLPKPEIFSTGGRKVTESLVHIIE